MNTGALRPPDARHEPHPIRLRIVALALLLLPAAFLLVFAFGEVAGGDVSGLQHVPEAALLLALAAAGWRYPRATGVVLLSVGAVLLALALALNLARGNPGESAPAVMLWAGLFGLLFAPPLVAGWLLLRSSGAPRR